MAQNTDKRIILYPNYLDSTISVAEGRVLSKEQACPAPDILEMFEAVKKLGLDVSVEEKHYPRSWWVRGRLRVGLKKDDGTPVNPEIPSKRVLMAKIADHIKNNPKRPPRIHAWSAAAILANMPGGPITKADKQEAGSSSSSASKAGGSNKKKKGKK